MTISTTIIKSSYSGNGSTTAFTYSFKITADTEVQVIVKTNATGAESVRSIGTGSTNYAVSGAGSSSGGTVTFVTAPTSLETVVLRRSTTQTQGMDLIENDPLPANTLETAIDKNLAISQELQEQIDRSLKISRANTMTSTEFITSATDRASKILAFDSSGELSVTQELGTFTGNWATSTAYVIRDLIKDTSNGNIYLANTAHTSSGSQPISGNTDVAKWDLIVDAASATTSAATATTQAGIATAQAVIATAKAVLTAADVVSTNANVVLTAADVVSAEAAKTAAEAALDSFDDVYLGAKSSAPTLDNDGDALTTGDIYFNTVGNDLQIWNGSAWQVAAASTAGFVTLGGSEVLTNKSISGSTNTLTAIPNSALAGSIANAKLANSAITINGSAVSLGGTVTVGETKPTITTSSVIIPLSTPTSVTLAGTNFASSSTVLPIVQAVASNGVLTNASSITWSSATSIAATFSLANGDYRVRVENPDGNAVVTANAILQASAAPTWTTAAGSLGSFAPLESISVTVVATEAGGADVDYAVTTGSIPFTLSLNAETGVISGTESGTSDTTTTSFGITGTDAQGQTTPERTFSITISHASTGGGQFN